MNDKVIIEKYVLPNQENWKAIIDNAITDYGFRLVITYYGNSMYEGFYPTYHGAKIALGRYEKGWVKQECI